MLAVYHKTLSLSKFFLALPKLFSYPDGVAKRYDQYCPIAHALDLVGDRWALLVVRELMHGPKRYTDLAAALSGIGTNVLAARLKELESAEIVTKRLLPPPAASRVYELTEYGQELRPALRELALWGARSLGPPTESNELFPGWLENALDVVLARLAPNGRLEFRVGDEVASIVDGEARSGPVADPDVVIEGDAKGVYHFLVDRTAAGVSVTGDRTLVEALLAAVPQPATA
jgi:DNA-binding HxlR family transcriptional regulator